MKIINNNNNTIIMIIINVKFANGINIYQGDIKYIKCPQHLLNQKLVIKDEIKSIN